MVEEFKQDKVFIEKAENIRLIIQQGIKDIWNPKLKISILKKDEEKIILVERKDKKIDEKD